MIIKNSTDKGTRIDSLLSNSFIKNGQTTTPQLAAQTAVTPAPLHDKGSNCASSYSLSSPPIPETTKQSKQTTQTTLTKHDMTLPPINQVAILEELTLNSQNYYPVQEEKIPIIPLPVKKLPNKVTKEKKISNSNPTAIPPLNPPKNSKNNKRALQAPTSSNNNLSSKRSRV